MKKRRIRRVRFGVVMAGVVGAIAASAAHGERLLLTPLAQISLPSWAFGSECAARIDGDRLVIPRGAGGVSVYDISDPAHPATVATVDIATLEDQGGASTITPDGRLMVSLPVRRVLAAIDISGAVPVKLGEFGDIPQTLRLAPANAGLIAYAQATSAYPGGVYAFDISTTLPAESGEYLVDLIDPGFFVRGDVAFFARTPRGPTDPAYVDVVDMSNPAQPLPLGEWAAETPGNIVGIDIAGERMALAAYWGGIWIVDVADVAAMHLLDHQDWSDSAIYSVDVAYMPPFVLLLQGGPSPDMRQLDTLRMHDDGTLEWLDPLPIDGIPMAILHHGSLVVVQSMIDTNGDGFPDETKLELFASDVELFADGFDGAGDRIR